jgi:hypothetical protein
MNAAVPALSEAAVGEQLNRILPSRYFASSDVRTRFCGSSLKRHSQAVGTI